MMAAQPEPPTQLVAHFIDRAREHHAQGWAELWDSDRDHFWDRGQASAALVDFLASRPAVLAHHDVTGTGTRRPRAFVPGCGKGYDVVMLALRGYDVYGLDVSPKGADTARTHARAALVDGADVAESNFAAHELGCLRQFFDSRGSVTILCGDFFKGNDWETECFPAEEDGARGFDLIYDYTFLCALPPEMRQDWARRMKKLLLPTGILICLEFPLYKDLGARGPPWGLRGVYWDLLAEGGDGILQEGDDNLSAAAVRRNSNAARGAFERVVYLQPERSHEIGRGTDMLSVWKLKPDERRP